MDCLPLVARGRPRSVVVGHHISTARPGAHGHSGQRGSPSAQKAATCRWRASCVHRSPLCHCQKIYLYHLRKMRGQLRKIPSRLAWRTWPRRSAVLQITRKHARKTHTGFAVKD